VRTATWFGHHQRTAAPVLEKTDGQASAVPQVRCDALKVEHLMGFQARRCWSVSQQAAFSTESAD